MIGSYDNNVRYPVYNPNLIFNSLAGNAIELSETEAILFLVSEEHRLG